MKSYDLVIEDSLEDLIEVTNQAVSYGYKPVGGMLYIENKFIQTIIKNKMDQIFFRSLFALLADKQAVKITTTRVGDNITLLITKDSKIITMTGTPEEVDNAIMDHLKVNTEPKEQSFNVTVSEVDDEDQDNDEKEEKPAANKPASKAKKSTPAAKKSTPKANPEKKPMEKEVEALKESADEKVTADIEAAKAQLKEFTTAMDAGNKCMKDKDYPGAITQFQIAVTKAPDGNTAAAEKASLARDKYEEHLKKIAFDEYMQLGLYQRKERKYEESLEAFKKAQELFPEDEEVKKQIVTADKWIKALADL